MLTRSKKRTAPTEDEQEVSAATTVASTSSLPSPAKKSRREERSEQQPAPLLRRSSRTPSLSANFMPKSAGNTKSRSSENIKSRSTENIESSKEISVLIDEKQNDAVAKKNDSKEERMSKVKRSCARMSTGGIAPRKMPTDQMASFNSLPCELIELILGFCNFHEIGALRGVNKSFNKTCLNLLRRGSLAAMREANLIFEVSQLAYSGPGRIIDQIQLLNKESNALLNEVEAQEKMILKHQRKIQELEEKEKGLQDLEERRWNGFLIWSVRLEMVQELTSEFKEEKQKIKFITKLVKVSKERQGKFIVLLSLCR